MNDKSKGTITRLSNLSIDNKVPYLVFGKKCIVGTQVYERKTDLNNGKPYWDKGTVQPTEFTNVFNTMLKDYEIIKKRNIKIVDYGKEIQKSYQDYRTYNEVSCESFTISKEKETKDLDLEYYNNYY